MSTTTQTPPVQAPPAQPDAANASGAGNSGHPAPVPEDKLTNSARLEKAIRQIVREEIGRPAEEEDKKKGPPKPTFVDAFWLLLIVTNLALLLALVPDTAIKNTKLDFFLKIVPLIGGYLFVLGYAWFRDAILNFSRHAVFKVAMLVVFAVLLPLSASKLQIFSIQPLIEPANANVAVDGEAVSVDSDGRIKISLQGHAIRISESGAQKPATRDFRMTFGDAFRAWTDSSFRPHWPLVQKVTVSVTNEISQLEITKEGDFDPDFWEKPWPAYGNAGVLTQGSQRNVLLFNWTSGDVQLYLPYGKYKITASKQNCSDSDPQTVEVGATAPTVNFEKDLCS